MDKEVLRKQKKRYGFGAILFAFALYLSGNIKSNIIEQGGTDETSATILVVINALFGIGFVICIVMWFVLGRKLKKTA